MRDLESVVQNEAHIHSEGLELAKVAPCFSLYIRSVSVGALYAGDRSAAPAPSKAAGRVVSVGRLKSVIPSARIFRGELGL